MNKTMLELINACDETFSSGDPALNAAAMGAQNVNSAMSTIDGLRQQLADVSNERDGLRAASQWVLIKDRMPEPDQECLIRIPVLNYFEIEGAKYLGDGQWLGAFCSTRGKGKCYTVTHWMPLPNPPTEQEAQQ